MVFITNGIEYADLKDMFLKFGWHENPDHESLCFDVKWVIKKKNIDFVNVLESQIINHFANNHVITA